MNEEMVLAHPNSKQTFCLAFKERTKKKKRKKNNLQINNWWVQTEEKHIGPFYSRKFIRCSLCIESNSYNTIIME